MTARGEPMRWIEAHKGYQGDECLPWPFGRGSDGYGVVFHNGRSTRAHRVMCEIVHGAPPFPEAHAAHNCGKGHEACTNPRHLRWDTAKGNAGDRAAHGTENSRERNHKARLTEAQVAEIRRLHSSDQASQQQLAEMFGVARSTIWHIVRNRSWRDEAAGDHFEDARKKKLARAHCLHGHLLDAANTAIRRDGTRNCRECDRIRAQRKRDRQRAA